MKTTFRFPGSSDYAFAEVSSSEGSPMDVARELRDVDDNFLSIVGDVLARGCALVAMGPLSPQVIQDSGSAASYDYQSPSQAPQMPHSAPQEAQGYPTAPQQGYAPQGASQGYQAPQQSYPQQPPAAPPGATAPTCQFHGQPAVYKPGGFSTRTNKSYDAFWACAQNDRGCTKASNFPKA